MDDRNTGIAPKSLEAGSHGSNISLPIVDPLQWRPAYKWATVGVLAWISFIAPMNSTLLAPAAPNIVKELNIHSSALSTFILSSFQLGLAAGPLVFAPMSEVYGRVPIYHASNFFFMICTLASSFSKSGAQLAVVRFFEGLLGSASLTVAAGSIADMFDPATRATAMAAWGVPCQFGFAAGPAIGGAMSHVLGWRCVLWIMSGIAALNIVACSLVLRETYMPVLLANRKLGARPSLGHISKALKRPGKLLFCSPVIAGIGVFIAVIWGIMLLLFTTIGFIFPRYYNFNEVSSGLVYLSPGFGMIIGGVVAGIFNNRLVRRVKTEGGGREVVAEDRLPCSVSLLGVAALVGGLLMYGWSIHSHVDPAVPIIGLFFFGFGVLWLANSVQQYAVEAFTLYTSSAIAAMAVLRSLLTGLLPLAGLGLFDRLGLGTGCTVLAGIALASVVFPVVCRLRGQVLRERFQPCL